MIIRFLLPLPPVFWAILIRLEYGSALKEDDRIPGDYPVMGSNGAVGTHEDCLIEGPAIIVGRKGSEGEASY